MGGTGGTGGGGAGGTVELYGSAVYAGSATVNTSSGDMTLGFDGQLLIGSNTPISMPTEQGVGNVYSTTGPTTTNPFISGSQNSTPLIAGLSGGAESFGLIPTGSSLYNELTASGGELFTAIANAPANALVAVLRESIPTSYQDQYSGYDLVLYVNLINMNLAGPELGVTQGSVNTNFEPALEYDSLANATGQQTIQAIPADGIFAILVPSTDPAGGQYVNAALSGSASNISGQPLVAGSPNYITIASPANVGPYLPGLQAITVSPDGQRTYALSVAKNQLVVTDNNLNELQVIGLNGLTSASQVVLSPDLKDLYVTEPGIGNVIVFARNTSSGVLTPTPVQTVFVGTNLTAALAINNAGTQVALGGSGGLKEYVRNSNGTLSFSNSAFQTNSITGVADVAYSQDGTDLYAVSPTTSTFAAFVASNLSFGPDVSFSGSTNGMVGASNIAVSHDDQYIYVIGRAGPDARGHPPPQLRKLVHYPGPRTRCERRRRTGGRQRRARLQRFQSGPPRAG